MNPKIKNLLLTLLFYGIAFSLIFPFNYLFPSGPCTPGGILIVPITLPFFAFILFLINLWKYKYRDDRENIFSMIIHGSVLFLYLILIVVLSTTFD